MSRLIKIALCLLAFSAGGTAFAAEEPGVSPSPPVLFHLFNVESLPVTNSMATSWAVSLLVLLLFRLAVKKPQFVPSRGQVVVENVVETLRDLFGPIVGKKAMPAAFPLLLCFFIFILLQNWSGLFPGVGTIGWGHTDAEGHFHLTRPWIRPANSDFNSTIALALISFGAWLIIVFKYAGPKVILEDIFGNKADKKELPAAMYYGLSLVFIFVGLIEVISICIRPVTLSARLFGNVYGGENLLHSTWFAPPFYFMEMLVGLVQALVFTLLSAVYIGLLCNHGDDHAHDEGHGHDDHKEAAPAAH